MQQYARPAIQIDAVWLIQQAQASPMAKSSAEQKITIAMQERHSGAAVGQRAKRVGNCAFEYADRVIANPGFEQVAQNVQRFSLAGRSGKKFNELVGDVRPRPCQMQVRYKNRCR